MLSLINKFESSWLEYKGQVIDSYALPESTTLLDDTLEISFPFIPEKNEELNNIAANKDFEVVSDRKMQATFRQIATIPKTTVNNYTQLPYRIDRDPNKQVIAYSPAFEDGLVVVDNSDQKPLSPLEIRFIKDTEFECNSSLAGKEVVLICPIIFNRYVKSLAGVIDDSLIVHLASLNEHQTLSGQVEACRFDELHSPIRTIKIVNVKEIAREPI